MGTIEGELPTPEGFDAVVADQWQVLAEPGPHLTGAQRVRIADLARGARAARRSDASPVEPTDAIERIAVAVAIDAADLVREGADRLAREGVSATCWAEVMGVVGRVVAVDSAVRGLGADEVPLPAPEPGDPTGRVDDGARTRGSLVPTVGPTNPGNILSSMPDEQAAFERLHSHLYLSMADMADLDISLDGLHRTQIEVVAGATSLANDCFW